jgi:hypothetical protein
MNPPVKCQAVGKVTNGGTADVFYQIDETIIGNTCRYLQGKHRLISQK